MNGKTLLIVDDDKDICDALKVTLENPGYKVLTANTVDDAMDVVARTNVHMVISDLKMEEASGIDLLKSIKRQRNPVPVVLITAYGDVSNAVEAMKNGAVDFIAKPFDPQVIINMVERYSAEDHPADESYCFLTASDSMRRILGLAKKVSASDATVMITGESGTGKEVLSRFIHNHSPRKDGPFIAINCAAIPENMLEATLFGYEKGAYTGAHQSCPGKFELAQGGTILLDEISEMDLSLQAKLLRVLQEREVERLGSRKSISLDVRVLATSNRNMKEVVAAGGFREDLYYRLNVFPLHVPPLRDRKEDILILSSAIIRNNIMQDRDNPYRLSSDAEKLLMKYDWPGNVRELENVIQRALILSSGQLIEDTDIHIEYDNVVTTEDDQSGLNKGMKEHEFKLINETLLEVNGNRKQAAERLGISQRTLRYKLARMRSSGYIAS